MLYIHHIACDDNEFIYIYQTYVLYISHKYVYMLLLYIYDIARDSLISIAITLATYEHISILYVYTESIEHGVCNGDKNDIM